MSNQATARIYRTGEVTDYMSISTVEHGGTWRVYKGPVENAIDCIRIREALSGFHLEYRTWNEGVGKYYPYVNSEDDSADSYAGLAGKAIQRVNIVAYDDNTNKVDTGIVVMYRARVDGSWLPWVSNANAASMQSVQEKYGGMDDLVLPVDMPASAEKTWMVFKSEYLWNNPLEEIQGVHQILVRAISMVQK